MVTCPDDGETTVKVKIPLDDIKVQKTRGHKKELKLSDVNFNEDLELLKRLIDS